MNLAKERWHYIVDISRFGCFISYRVFTCRSAGSVVHPAVLLPARIKRFYRVNLKNTCCLCLNGIMRSPMEQCLLKWACSAHVCTGNFENFHARVSDRSMRPSQTIQTATLDYISMVQYTTAVTPVRYQWNYCSLAPRYIYIYIYIHYWFQWLFLELFRIVICKTSPEILTHLLWTKWPPFRRRYFQIHFHEWKMYFD